MLEILKGMVHNLIVVLLLATFLDMLLPQSAFRRHIRLVVGLFVMLTILQPVLQLFHWQGTFHFSIREPPGAETGPLMRRGLELQAAQETRALQAAEERLEQQLEAMICLHLGLDEVKADLILEKNPEQGPVVREVTIYVFPGENGTVVKQVAPVVVDTGQPPPDRPGENAPPAPGWEPMRDRIINGVSAYLGLDPARIRVVIAP